MVNLKKASIEKIQSKEFNESNIKVDILRLDKIHETISGNKWFKLKYYLEEAVSGKFATILTFGGAYSNHILATACAANMLGMKSVGVIRGENHALSSHTLVEAENYGMRFEFITRDEYRRKNEKDFLESLKTKFQGSYIIPEGGAGNLGVRGSAEILACIEPGNYSHILCAIGTGTMFCGIANASLPNQKIIGIPVLKGMENSLAEIYQKITPEKIVDCEIKKEYHFGGYAKKNDELIRFMNSFYQETNIPTDFVYTAKLMYATIDLVKKKYFSPGSRLLIIHSGGLQGNLSFSKGTIDF